MDRDAILSQTLEWLMLVDEEQERIRTRNLIDGAHAAAAAQATERGFRDFINSLKRMLKRK